MASLDRLRGKRILVVEDEFLLADDLSRALRDAGAEVIGPAPSVQKAQRLLESAGPFDAAVLDVNLRDVLRYSIARTLQAQATAFLFTTGYDQGLIPDQFKTVPWVQKPYGPRDLLDKLAELL